MSRHMAENMSWKEMKECVAIIVNCVIWVLKLGIDIPCIFNREDTSRQWIEFVRETGHWTCWGWPFSGRPLSSRRRWRRRHGETPHLCQTTKFWLPRYTFCQRRYLLWQWKWWWRWWWRDHFKFSGQFFSRRKNRWTTKFLPVPIRTFFPSIQLRT